jgi:hypothetical protein
MSWYLKAGDAVQTLEEFTRVASRRRRAGAPVVPGRPAEPTKDRPAAPGWTKSFELTAYTPLVRYSASTTKDR